MRYAQSLRVAAGGPIEVGTNVRLGRVPRGICFVAGTLVLTAHGLEPIESIEVGERVITSNAETTETTSDEFTEHDCHLIHLGMPNPDGSGDVIEIETLRSRSWLESTDCEEGHTIWFSLPEMGLYGPAEVESIEGRPDIEEGPGRVVRTTVTHLNGYVLRIWLDREEEPIEPTKLHRLYSEDRAAWVPAGELTVGERLRTRAGPREIVRVDSKPGLHRVYNLEVATEHCFYVSCAEVLSHNTDPCGSSFPRNLEVNQQEQWICWVLQQQIEAGVPKRQVRGMILDMIRDARLPAKTTNRLKAYVDRLVFTYLDWAD
jgi:hypothetical protein